ncbi:MAG: DNA mismatch repair endonuclease MutL [Capsulimonadales bacterium]|nr:DNA mismatch repair endonuclease MutL [Capsulimonadales bacterium]
MPQIVNLLDDSTANRIAAGEVIERPSSVVKELVENSLDAGATRIEVELEEGGKRRIRVRDNGCGMVREDAVLCLQRHATSKIRSADDLFAIRTLGFRGEALPSIASVSDFHLVTKPAEEETATEIRVSGGEMVRVEDAAGPDGTTITIENLFFNTPARLKFMKTAQTELNQTTDLLHRLILAYHQVAFRLVHDGYEVLSYPGSHDPRVAVAAVWGRDAVREMVPLNYVSTSLSVTGFVSKPSLTRATRSAQAMFVNGRFVRSRTMTHAFDSAFKQLMTGDRFPVVALFLSIAPELVDVNVHPTKIEVRFSREGDVYSAVHQAVRNAMLTGGLMPEVRVEASLSAETAPAGTAPIDIVRGSALPPKTALSSFGRSEVMLPTTAVVESGDGTGADAGAMVPTGQPEIVFSEGDPSVRPPSDDGYIGFDGYRIGRLRVIGQSRNTYIVAETEDAILLIDQHIAHERVLYEQMMNGATEQAARWGVVAQRLVLPQTVEFAAREAKIVAERRSALERAGFLLEPFGGGTFVLRAVPAAVADRGPENILREIIEEMTAESVARRLPVPQETAIIMASCKMAVKKGDPLTMEEMTRLLTDLAAMRNPFTCPHGRPILLALTHREMDRKFHRIGPH